jgi:hypothetical protein
MTKKSEIRWLVLLGLLGLALRIGLIYSGTAKSGLGIGDDDGDNLNFANTLVTEGYYASHGLNDDPLLRAWKPPVFSYFVAAIFKMHGQESYLPVRWYLVFLSLLVPFCAWLFTRAIGGVVPAVLAFGWACIHPPFVYYAAHIQNDSVFYVLAAIALLVTILQKTAFQSGLAGFLTGIAALTRSQFFGAMGIGFLWSLWKPRETSRRWWAMVYIAGFLLAVSPWWIRNYRIFHHFVPFSTEGGYTMWVGNNPLSTGGGDCPDSHAPKGLSELERDRWHYREAVQYIRTHPKRTIYMAGVKLARLWAIVPQVGGPSMKLFFLFIYVPLFSLTIVGLWMYRSRMKYFLPILGMCVFYSVVQPLFHAVLRYRLPLEPYFISIASLGLFALIKKLENKPVLPKI